MEILENRPVLVKKGSNRYRLIGKEGKDYMLLGLSDKYATTEIGGVLIHNEELEEILKAMKTIMEDRHGIY